MTPKELKQIFPVWYQEWLFDGLGVREDEEISERYLAPLFRLNKNWLDGNYVHNDYSWDEIDVATSYALYYMTINIPKLWMVLGHSGVWRQRELKEISSIIEFGCGPGTFLWSFLFFLQDKSPELLPKIKKICGIDSSATNIKIAENLFKKLRMQKGYAHIEAEFICGKWEDHLNDGNFQLGIFGNSLVESTFSLNLDLLQDRFSNLLILEPGTLQLFSKLRNVRDALVSKGWCIHFPCSGGSSCPMAADNWCHFHINRFLLPFIQRMSAAANRQNHRHNFSAFLLSRRENQDDEMSWRILSSPRKMKGTAKRYLCNGLRMIEAVMGRKAKTEQNKDFIRLDTGTMGHSTSKFQNMRFQKNDAFRRVDY